MDAPPSVAFSVAMTCEGCAGAVRRVLGKLPGVGAVAVDVAAKRVVVTGGSAPAGEMLAALEKWGSAAGKAVALATA